MSAEEKKYLDEEMPDANQEIHPDDEGKFTVPSQWNNKPDVKYGSRLQSDIIFQYFRDDECIAVLDFTDFLCNPDDIKDMDKSDLFANIEIGSRTIAMKTVPGGLQPGDIEKFNEYSTTITQEMIDELDLNAPIAQEK